MKIHIKYKTQHFYYSLQQKKVYMHPNKSNLNRHKTVKNK